MLEQQDRKEVERNRRRVLTIEKKCLLTSQQDAQSKIKLHRLKMQKAQDCGEPTMDEQLALREDLEREIKINPMYKKDI